MKWESEVDLFVMVNIAPGLWINPGDVMAARDMRNGYVQVWLRGAGSPFQVKNLTADKLVKQLADAAKKVHGG